MDITIEQIRAAIDATYGTGIFGLDYGPSSQIIMICLSTGLAVFLGIGKTWAEWGETTSSMRIVRVGILCAFLIPVGVFNRHFWWEPINQEISGSADTIFMADQYLTATSGPTAAEANIIQLIDARTRLQGTLLKVDRMQRLQMLMQKTSPLTSKKMTLAEFVALAGVSGI